MTYLKLVVSISNWHENVLDNTILCNTIALYLFPGYDVHDKALAIDFIAISHKMWYKEKEQIMELLQYKLSG